MAEASTTGDKTEKASAQKLKKSREQGQSARSRDLVTAIGILVSLKLIVFLMPGYLDDFRILFAQTYTSLDGAGTLDNVWSGLFAITLGLIAKMLLPLAVVPFAAVLGSLVPGGLAWSTSHWLPKFERLNPATNLGRVVSPKHLFELGVSVAKAALLIGVGIHVVRSSLADYMHLQALPMNQALVQGATMMIDGVMAMCMVFVLFAAIDVPAQTFFYLRGQRMSKQDQKDEHKSQEGSPEVRQRMRQLQRQFARRSVRKTVPTADVVIVNPEHYAVALKYDGDRAEAPYVVAKGIDEIALYIREVALEHGIEVLPLPPLARAIYNTSQVNQQIPMTLYRAVAAVLTYVLQMQAFRSGRRPAQPALPTHLAVPTNLSESVPT